MHKWMENNPIKSIILLAFVVIGLLFAVSTFASDDFTENDSPQAVAEGRVIDESDLPSDLLKDHQVDLDKEPIVYEDEDGGRGFIYWEATKDKFSDTIEAIKAFVEDNSTDKVGDLEEVPDVEAPVGNEQPAVVTTEETNS